MIDMAFVLGGIARRSVLIKGAPLLNRPEGFNATYMYIKPY